MIFISLIVMPCMATAAGFKSESFTLSNGMQVIVIPNNKVAAVSHMVFYKVGSVDEVPGKSGLAHFLEHLMFKGTTKYPDGEFSKKVSKAGGNDNAFTTYDYTGYYQNISIDKLEMVMDMESDRMQNLIIKNDAVLKERDVIIEERNTRTDNNPSTLLSEQMMAALYLNHHYGIPVIGWKHEMQELNTTDALNFYLKYYRPNNAVLIVSGDINAEKLKPLAEKYYGVIKAGDTVTRINIMEPPAIAERSVILHDEKVKQPGYTRYYLAPGINSDGKEHIYALQVLDRILGGSITGRLYQELVVNQKAAASVSSDYDELSLGNSEFIIHAIPAGDISPETIATMINKEVAKILTNGVTSDELERAKKAMTAEAIYSMEDLKTLAYIYGRAVLTGAGTEYVEKWQENIAKVSVNDIKSAALYVLKPEKSVSGILYPE